MAKKQKTEKPTQRTKVKDLPQKERALSKDEQKQVQGGIQGRRAEETNSDFFEDFVIRGN